MVIEKERKVGTPSRIFMKPHHAHVSGPVRGFFLHADPTMHELADTYLEEFSADVGMDWGRRYDKYGGGSDVVGDTPEEFKGFVRGLTHYNRNIHRYPDNLPVRIMVTKRDPLCHLAVRRRHCEDYIESEKARRGEVQYAEEIHDHINYFVPGGARVRRLREPHRVSVETTWGALTTYWKRWEEVAEEVR